MSKQISQLNELAAAEARSSLPPSWYASLVPLAPQHSHYPTHSFLGSLTVSTLISPLYHFFPSLQLLYHLLRASILSQVSQISPSSFPCKSGTDYCCSVLSLFQNSSLAPIGQFQQPPALLNSAFNCYVFELKDANVTPHPCALAKVSN